jgi:DNA-binding transcriptional LysR family regulator
MILTNLDMDVLRTLVVATDLGGFVRAADRLGRSQSAISLQMKKLEEQVGQELFKKAGRGVSLTDAGDVLVQYARRILELNDEAVSVTRGVAVEGSVHVGMPQDLAGRWLPELLARFKADDPHVHVEAQVGRNRDLIAAIQRGSLDLAILFGDSERGLYRTIEAIPLPMVWVGKSELVAEETLPLALLDIPCLFRQTALEALHAERKPWRIAFTSPNLPGLWAAVGAGLGITVRTPIGIPAGVETLSEGLPVLNPVELLLIGSDRPPSPAADRFRAIVTDLLEREGAARK